MMKKELMVESFDGVKLFMAKSLPEDMAATVVVVHGLAEHSGRYKYLEEKLNDANIGVYRFDHRGHGQSQGEETHYKDFNELTDDVNHIVELAKGENPNLPIFIIGHSMGGFGVAAFGTKYPNKVDGIVISGGLTRDHYGTISSVPEDLADDFRLPNELTDGVCSVEEVRLDYVNDPLNKKSFTVGLARSLASGVDWLSKRAEVFNYPVLLLHGQLDSLVSYKDSLDFFSEISSKDKQVKIYGNLFHEIFNEYARDEVIGDVIVWMQNRM